MPKITVAHKPGLSKEQAQEIFARHFAGTYDVHAFSGPFRDFVVEKNAFVGVAVKLEQTGNETRFVFNGLAPKWWARALLGAIVGMVLWPPITKEVRTFVETAPEFH